MYVCRWVGGWLWIGEYVDELIDGWNYGWMSGLLEGWIGVDRWMGVNGLRENDIRKSCEKFPCYVDNFQ